MAPCSRPSFFLHSLAALAVFAIATALSQAAKPSATLVRPLPNRFAELLGKTNQEVDAKINAAWQQLFYGRDEDQRVFYPVQGEMAYIADTGNVDVRTEGMSYGMMIAVQFNKRAEFDRLWKWAKTHMYHPDGPRHGYFAWQCRYDGTQIDPGSASDGEEWFAMALLFAANRWGSGEGIFNYAEEAQALLDAMRTENRSGGITAIFNKEHKQVVFAPTESASKFTDPSYHLPAFYELWARWDKNAEGRAFWAACAAESRAYFHRAAHPETGLMPEYSEFDGRPRPGDRGDFRYDAWRSIANVALDHAWFGKDPWQVERTTRVLNFLAKNGPDYPNQFTLDGRPLSSQSSRGLFSMAAVGALAVDKTLGKPFVQRLWEIEIPAGKYRYYDGLLYFLGLLQVSGRFEVYAPQSR
ncbi:MAG: glycosyl hydrolase family 8 [Nibricoccus sp.]